MILRSHRNPDNGPSLFAELLPSEVVDEAGVLQPGALPRRPDRLSRCDLRLQVATDAAAGLTCLLSHTLPYQPGRREP
jgi:hypothetical protein